MQNDVISIALGFVEGLGLVLSPCILPIIPILMAGSLSGTRHRPLGIMLGFSLFFALVVFFSKQVVAISGIHLDLLRFWSYGILTLLGIMMLSPYLSEQFSRLTQGLAQFSAYFSSPTGHDPGFLNGVFFGGLVAIIWTPCAGPILAAVLVQIILQQSHFNSFLILISFALGAVLPMYLIAYYGRELLSTVQFLKTKTIIIRQTLGLMLIASVLYMVFFSNEIGNSTVENTDIKYSTSLVNGLWSPYQAPPIAGIESWINSKPLSITDLKGKVVLVDFWTYSCINCIRTLPYLKTWYEKYHQQGFEIIGVHSPEFEFEKNLANVKSAVTRNGILYPVALDNKFMTWTNYANQYWPAHYLINKQGKVVYTHFGEGQYAITENNIRYLLGMTQLDKLAQDKVDPFWIGQTPETYLGYLRADPKLSPLLIHDQIHQYHFPDSLRTHAWSLDGAWIAKGDHLISAEPNARLKIHYKAGKVYMVMGKSPDKPVLVKLLLDGKPLQNNPGKDVKESSILVNNHMLYEVVSSPELIGGNLDIIATAPGLSVYTFTFGR